MEIDAKHVVLFALYAEYQKDIPEMANITSETLNMDARAFNMALLKLQSEGFIDGLQIFPSGTRMLPKTVILDSVLPTRFGVEYVETKLSIEKSKAGPEKLNFLIAQCGKFGWDVLQALVLKILSG
jgi:hypothetical protein